jgi:hypothetical protein
MWCADTDIPYPGFITQAGDMPVLLLLALGTLKT